MKWYTLENGRLCLGTANRCKANFHIATDVKLENALSTPLLEEHVDIIGSYPEDWYADEAIDSKINSTAKHFFGLATAVA